MLIRIRRLAGTAVGAVFILLLSLSMLQLGEAVNPVSLIQGSPVVIEVGDEKQRWNTLNTAEATSNLLFGLSAEDYIEQGYGPLTTALAVKDSWSQGDVGLSRTILGNLQSDAFRQQVPYTQGSLQRTIEVVAPWANILAALTFQTEAPSTPAGGASSPGKPHLQF